MVPKPSPPGVLLSSLPPLAPAAEVEGWGGDCMDWEWEWEWEELEDMFSPGWVTRSCFSTTILLVSFVVLKAMDLVVYGAGMPTSLKTVGGQGQVLCCVRLWYVHLVENGGWARFGFVLCAAHLVENSGWARLIFVCVCVRLWSSAMSPCVFHCYLA